MSGPYRQSVSATSPVRHRLYTLLVALLGLNLTLLAYVVYGHPVYGYLGLAYAPLSFDAYVLSSLMAILPALVLPADLKRPSDLVSWIIYFFCYIPTTIIFPASGLLANTTVFAYLISFFAGMILIIGIPRLRVPTFSIPSALSRAFPVVLLSCFILLSVYIVIQNYSIMRFVGFSDVYDQRFLGAETVGLSAYAMGNLSGAINPLLVSLGLLQRKKLYLVLGVIGQLLVYSVMAHKFVLISLVYIPAFYFMLYFRGDPLSSPPPSLLPIGLSFSAALLLGLCFASISFFVPSIGLFEDMTALLLMRLVLLPASLGPQYALFFDSHPLTLMSHVGLGKLFFVSPYLDQISIEIGYFLNNGAKGMNANVNFFSFDGTASFGILGPALIGIIVGSTLLLLNMFSRRHSIAIVSLSSSTLAFTLTESSYFTTMITGGGLLLIVLLYLLNVNNQPLAPSDNRKYGISLPRPAGVFGHD